jgi:hypothetical protein
MLALGASNRSAAEKVLKALGVDSLKVLDTSRYAEAMDKIRAAS